MVLKTAGSKTKKPCDPVVTLLKSVQLGEERCPFQEIKDFTLEHLLKNEKETNPKHVTAQA